MEDDPRKYEPRIDAFKFQDDAGEFTPEPSASIPLSKDRQHAVDTVIALYNGKMAEHLEDFEAVYAKAAVYDDIMSFADTRRKVAAQFYALPKCFSKVEVLEHQVCLAEDHLICIKLKTAYTAPLLGTKEVKHIVSLSLDPQSDTALIRYHKDQWNEKDYSHEGLGAIMKKVNAEGVPLILNLPDSL